MHALRCLGPALQEQMGAAPGKDGLPSASQHANMFSGAQQQQQKAAAALPAMPSTTVTSGEDMHLYVQLLSVWPGMEGRLVLLQSARCRQRNSRRQSPCRRSSTDIVWILFSEAKAHLQPQQPLWTASGYAQGLQ